MDSAIGRKMISAFGSGFIPDSIRFPGESVGMVKTFYNLSSSLYTGKTRLDPLYDENNFVVEGCELNLVDSQSVVRQSWNTQVITNAWHCWEFNHYIMNIVMTKETALNHLIFPPSFSQASR